MSALADPLVGLRPYQLPEPISWWPPAPGWWLLLAAGLITLAVLLWQRRHARQQHSPATLALRELAALDATYSRNADASAYVRGLSTLLRRFVLVTVPGQAPAGLSGERWLRFLADHDDGDTFRSGVGRCLIDAPYRQPWNGTDGAPTPTAARPIADADVLTLGAAVRRWLSRNEPADRRWPVRRRGRQVAPTAANPVTPG